MNQVSSMEIQVSPFKGFLIRLLAFVIDVVVTLIAIIAAAVVFLIFFDSLFGIEAGFFAALIMFILAGLAAQFLYKPLMEASEYQGTIGKIALSMKVVDKHGRRITMAKSFIRTIVYIIEHAIPFGSLAFLIIVFTDENQGLHDMASETYVVSKYWQGPVPLQDNFGA
ncbi:MAG: hypothetical protein CMB06_04835 [Euryarchaeota archaeon]|nr:hypothetical protein [Euryarchaeota archaeon]